MDSLAEIAQRAYQEGCEKTDIPLSRLRTLARSVGRHNFYSYLACQHWQDSYFFIPDIAQTLLEGAFRKKADGSFHTDHGPKLGEVLPDDRFDFSKPVIIGWLNECKSHIVYAGMYWPEKRFLPNARRLARKLHGGLGASFTAGWKWPLPIYEATADILFQGEVETSGYRLGGLYQWGDDRFKILIEKKVGEGETARRLYEKYRLSSRHYRFVMPRLLDGVKPEFLVRLPSRDFYKTASRYAKLRNKWFEEDVWVYQRHDDEKRLLKRVNRVLERKYTQQPRPVPTPRHVVVMSAVN